MKKIFNLAVIITLSIALVSCGGETTTQESAAVNNEASTETVSDGLENTNEGVMSALNYVDPGSISLEVLDKIADQLAEQLPEVAGMDAMISKEDAMYELSIGENTSERFVTEYHIQVNAETFEIKIMDMMEAEYVSIEEYKKNQAENK